MGMIHFADLTVRVLLCIWAAQLIWIGSHFLERLAKKVLRSVRTSEEATEEASQGLRSTT
jgi:O-antigen ligase